MTTELDILRAALDQWKAGIDEHEPKRVAALSPTTRSSRACTVRRGAGRRGRVLRLTAAGHDGGYRILESRRLGADVALGYLAAEFGYRDREIVHLRVGVVVTHHRRELADRVLPSQRSTAVISKRRL